MDWPRFALILLATLVGLLMPSFYDWSGEDQSRPAPVVRFVGLAIIACDALAIGWLIWQHVSQRRTAARPSVASESSDDLSNDVLSNDVYQQDSISIERASLRSSWNRFSISALMVLTTLVAVTVAAWRFLAVPAVDSLLLYLVVATVLLSIRYPMMRWNSAALLFCLWAPFLWIFRWPEFQGQLTNYIMLLPGAPGILPAIYFAQMFGWPNPMFLGAGCAGLELLIGLLLHRKGDRLSLGYLLCVLTLSLVNSFVLQALVRM